jgi:hypothetical protein
MVVRGLDPGKRAGAPVILGYDIANSGQEDA